MKSFVAAVAAVLSSVSFVFAGDAGEPQSVLVQQPTTTIVASEPAPAIIAGNCSDCACNGSCAAVRGGRSRFRVVTEECDACTGSTVRSVTRGVVRGTGNVVRGVGAATYNVITLPVRAVRGARCCGGHCGAACGSCCR